MAYSPTASVHDRKASAVSFATLEGRTSQIEAKVGTAVMKSARNKQQSFFPNHRRRLVVRPAEPPWGVVRKDGRGRVKRRKERVQGCHRRGASGKG